MKYTKPTYEIQIIEVSDVITASSSIPGTPTVENAGQAELGSIEGQKGVYSTLFDWIS